MVHRARPAEPLKPFQRRFSQRTARLGEIGQDTPQMTLQCLTTTSTLLIVEVQYHPLDLEAGVERTIVRLGIYNRPVSHEHYLYPTVPLLGHASRTRGWNEVSQTSLRVAFPWGVGV